MTHILQNLHFRWNFCVLSSYKPKTYILHATFPMEPMELCDFQKGKVFILFNYLIN